MITDRINVKCNGQNVDRIVGNNGEVLGTLSAEVENGDQYVKPSGKKPITTNGTHDVSEYAEVEVNVQGGVTPVYQQKEVKPSLVEQIITADTEDGYDALSMVTVQAAAIQPPKTVTPGSTAQHITPDDGFIGLSEVIVGAGGGSSEPKLATYLGKCTMIMGGQEGGGSFGSLTIRVPYEEVPRGYFFTANGYTKSTQELRQIWMYVNAANEVGGKYSRGNAATADADQMVNAPSGLTITKIDDDWLEIKALPTSNPAIYPAGTAYRDWYAFRLSDTISEVND